MAKGKIETFNDLVKILREDQLNELENGFNELKSKYSQDIPGNNIDGLCLTKNTRVYVNLTSDKKIEGISLYSYNLYPNLDHIWSAVGTRIAVDHKLQFFSYTDGKFIKAYHQECVFAQLDYLKHKNIESTFLRDQIKRIGDAQITFSEIIKKEIDRIIKL